MNKLSAVEVERSILGCIMCEASLKNKIEALHEDLLSVEIHKRIFNIMKDLYKKDLGLDLASIMSVVKSKNNISSESSEGMVSLLSQMAAVYNTVYIDEHIDTLKEVYRKNCVLNLAGSIYQNINDGKDSATTLSLFEQGAKNIIEDGGKNKDSMNSIGHELLDILENNKQRGFKFDIPILDDIIGGIYECELTTIAARSGGGKSALAQQIMLNAASQGKKVLYISREMSSQQVLMRNITKKTGISSKDMKYKNLSEEDWIQIINYINEVASENLIYINDDISTTGGIRNRIRQVEPDLVIVDYVQLLTLEQRLQSREREVASLSRELKNITLDFKVPVIQLSQLNDEMKDMRPWGERPMRDSKAIYHDSNSVVYIHEPVGGDFDKALERSGLDRYMVINTKKDKGVKLVEIVVAKCRDGETNYRNYWFNGPRLHFEEIVG